MTPNNRFFLNLLQYYSRDRAKQGFVLPTLIGLGLIMTVVGLTMISRSSNEQLTAISQKQSAQALAIAETGANRVLAALNQPNNSELLSLNLDKWNDPDEIDNPCLSSDQIDEIKGGSIDDQGSYELTDYQYDDTNQEGTLQVKGTVGEAKQQIQLVVNVFEQPLQDSFGGLVGKQNIDLGNNDVVDEGSPATSLANVLCQDCTLDANDLAAYCDDPTSDSGQQAVRSAVGAKKNSVIDGNILLGELNLPKVKSPPENTNKL